MSAHRQTTLQTSIEDLTHQAMATILEEPNTRVLRRVLRHLGPERCVDLLTQTLHVEAGGGLLITAGDRRRIRGGVFLHLARQQVRQELGKRSCKRVFG